MENLSEAAIYVGTYAKYNSGSLGGKWLRLDQFQSVEEFYGACRELHSDEDDPEYMFQDWENIPTGLVSEAHISPTVFIAMQAIAQLDNHEEEPFLIWLANDLSVLDQKDADELAQSFRDSYRGAYESERDFAEETAQHHYDDTQAWLWRYFNYEAFARDLFISDYWFRDGYVFSNY